TPGQPTDPNSGGCEQKAYDRFDGGSDPARGCFAKLEQKVPNDCCTFGDKDNAKDTIDQCVGQLVSAIDPLPATQSRCGVGKERCVETKLASVLKCHQKAETPGRPSDPNFGGCIDKAVARYDGGVDPSRGCFARLEGKPGNDCEPPLGNQEQLESLVD